MKKAPPSSQHQQWYYCITSNKKNMKMNFVLFTQLIILLIIGCEKDDGKKNYESMCYQETNCDNPWDRGISNEETINNIELFLDSIKVIYRDLSINYNNDLFESCRSCECLTGNVVKLRVSSETISKLDSLNFLKCN